MFYSDVIANLNDESLKKAIDELKENTTYLKIIGCYKREVY
jgi:prephenate dehydratase